MTTSHQHTIRKHSITGIILKCCTKKRVSNKKVQSQLNEKTILMDCYFYKLELISLNNPPAKNHVIFEQPEQNEIIPSIVTWLYIIQIYLMALSQNQHHLFLQAVKS